jgi:hypothetical protein
MRVGVLLILSFFAQSAVFFPSRCFFRFFVRYRHYALQVCSCINTGDSKGKSGTMLKYFLMILWPFGWGRLTIFDLAGLLFAGCVYFGMFWVITILQIVISKMIADKKLKQKSISQVKRQKISVHNNRPGNRIIKPVQQGTFTIADIQQRLTDIGKSFEANMRQLDSPLGNQRMFNKIAWHGTKTLEAAKEILKYNFWEISKDVLIKGIHFSDKKQASTYGDYLVKVKISCPLDAVKDSELDKALGSVLVKMGGSSGGFHYYIPAKPTKKGQKLRPEWVKPLEIYHNKEG